MKLSTCSPVILDVLKRVQIFEEPFAQDSDAFAQDSDAFAQGSNAFVSCSVPFI